MMKLLTFLLVLLLWQISRLRILAHRVSLIEHYQAALEKIFTRFPKIAQPLSLAIFVFLAPLVLTGIDTLLGPTLFGFIFESIVLFLALVALSSYGFKSTQPPVLPEALEEKNLASIPELMWRLNYQWVTPLFWYLASGILGLTVYCLLAYFQQSERSKLKALARPWLEALAWIPVRILAFAYAVAGDFSKGMKILSDYLMAGTPYNYFILQRTVLANFSLEKDQNMAAQCERLHRDAIILLLGLYAVAAILMWTI